jgi:O-acetyl-ADP-ribose deacetylase (regulator of RNase III)
MPHAGRLSHWRSPITGGYRLPARYVIHTVGPVWRDGRRGEDADLADCYRNSLALARDHALRSIAFPAISTGAYGFPLERATRIAIRTTREFLNSNPLPDPDLRLLRTDAAETYRRVLAETVE